MTDIKLTLYTTDELKKILESCSIEQLRFIEDNLPHFIKRFTSKYGVEAGITYLAACCDGAYGQDGAGFNKADTRFGKYLAAFIEVKGGLTQGLTPSAHKLCTKYKGQLNRAGIGFGNLEESIELAKVKIDNLPEKRIQLLDGRVQAFFPYAPEKITKCKELKGSYNPNNKSWCWEPKKVNDALKLQDGYFVVFPEVTELQEQIEEILEKERIEKERIEKERIEKEEAERIETLNIVNQKATAINELVGLANLDGQLANGWFLRDYQKKGVEFLLSHHKNALYEGAILADDMGLGKTVTALAAAKSLYKYYNEELVVFVISPVSVRENWGIEASYVELPIETFSWAKLPNALESQKFLLICDEAHYAQGGKTTKRGKALLELAKNENCIGSWLLTGTPLKNGRPVNLLPLLQVVKHPIVENEYQFKVKYCNGHKGQFGFDCSGASHLKELSHKTEDVILRRTKKECLTELPEKTRLFSGVELDKNKSGDYQEAINEMVAAYQAKIEEKVAFFKRLNTIVDSYNAGYISAEQLLEEYNEFANLDESLDTVEEIIGNLDKKIIGDIEKQAKSVKNFEAAEALVTLGQLRKIGSEYKLEAATEIAQQLLDNDDSVVLFTAYKDTAHQLHNILGGELLTGDTPQKDRQAQVDRFQTGQSKVFVSMIQAGGVGITLTASSNVILVDRPWTPGDTEQAEDRVYRLGQKNAVFAHWLQLGAVDQMVDKLIAEKQERIDIVLKGKKKTLKNTGSIRDLAVELLAILSGKS